MMYELSKEEDTMIKKFILFIICLLFISIIGYKVFTSEKKYEDITINRDIYTISDCVEYAKDTLKLHDKDIHLSEIGFFCDSIDSAEVRGVNIGFVEVNKYIPFKHYIWYTITIDLKNKTASNMKKTYGKYIIYDDLDFDQWKLDLNDVFTNDKIIAKLNEYELMLGTGISVVTSNTEWNYIVTTTDEQNMRISIDPR